jgi:hypothetical protein
MDMNAITKLTAAALGAMSIAGGVALAQAPSAENPNDGRTATANYGTPPGAPLKRDGSLRADQAAAPMASPATTDSSSSTTTTTTTTSTTPAAEPAPAATPAAPADISPPPRADRN